MHIFQTVTKEGGGDYRMQVGAESALGGVQVLSQKDILRKIDQIFGLQSAAPN